MIIYTKKITQNLMQSLSWTSSNKVAKKSHTLLRITTYNVLQNWINLTSYNSAFEMIAEQLIETIINDIKCHKTEVVLQAIPGSRKHLSKKARRNLQKVQNDQSQITKDYSTGKREVIESVDEKDSTMCAKALECLGTIILKCGSFLKPNLHKILHETIVILAYTVVNGNLEINNVYTYWKCRSELLRCLTNLVVSSHSLVPPPLQYALEILTISSRRDPNKDVQNISSNLLHSIEKIIHPHKQSLAFKYDEEDEDEDHVDVPVNMEIANDGDSTGTCIDEDVSHVTNSNDNNISVDEDIEKTLDKIIEEKNNTTIIHESSSENDDYTVLRMSISPLSPQNEGKTIPKPKNKSSESESTPVFNDIVILSQNSIQSAKVNDRVTLDESIKTTEKTTNGNALTIDVSENETSNQVNKRRSNQCETIDLDSDNNDDNDDVMEVVDISEPPCKKVKAAELTKETVIDCDKMDDMLESFEADFNDEVNVHVIAD